MICSVTELAEHIRRCHPSVLGRGDMGMPTAPVADADMTFEEFTSQQSEFPYVVLGSD